MKYSTFIIFFLFTSVSVVQSQQWFPLGAQWHWGTQSPTPPFENYILKTVTNDTIIDSLRCVQFDDFGPFRICETNDRIYAIDPNYSEVKLLYDFSKNIGESWIFSSSGVGGMVEDTFEITISNIVDFVTISGDTLEQYQLSIDVVADVSGCIALEPQNNIFPVNVNTFKYLGNELLEEVFLYHSCGYADIFRYFRCYEDDYFGNVKLTNLPCDTVIWPNGVNDISFSGFSVFPNPVNGNILNIESEQDDLERVSIYNALGVLVYQEDNLKGNSFQAGLPDLDRGTYVIKVETADNKVGVRKFIR